MKTINLYILFWVVVTLSACDKGGGDVNKHSDELQVEWISEIVDYAPSVGQFINQPSLGTLDAAKKIVGGKNNMVSLGGFGGSITFRFKSDVRNQTGVDFLIYGNAFETNSEPGIVMVSYDANGNGVADDPWYELAGDETPMYENYELTWDRPANIETKSNVNWVDNQGNKDFYDVSIVPHKQCYFPLMYGNDKGKLTFKGKRLKNNGLEESGLWVLKPLGRGYADNYSSDYTEMVANLPYTKYSNKFDISNAIDSNGEPVRLSKITFVKVYTAVHQQSESTLVDSETDNSTSVGECSTEVCGALSLAPSR